MEDKGSYPNRLGEMLEACGKRPIDLIQALQLGNPAIYNIVNWKRRPSFHRAQSICKVLTEWAGREVTVAAIFPQGAWGGGRCQPRRQRSTRA